MGYSHARVGSDQRRTADRRPVRRAGRLVRLRLHPRLSRRPRVGREGRPGPGGPDLPLNGSTASAACANWSLCRDHSLARARSSTSIGRAMLVPRPTLRYANGPSGSVSDNSTTTVFSSVYYRTASSTLSRPISLSLYPP